MAPSTTERQSKRSLGITVSAFSMFKTWTWSVIPKTWLTTGRVSFDYWIWKLIRYLPSLQVRILLGSLLLAVFLRSISSMGWQALWCLAWRPLMYALLRYNLPIISHLRLPKQFRILFGLAVGLGRYWTESLVNAISTCCCCQFWYLCPGPYSVEKNYKPMNSCRADGPRNSETVSRHCGNHDLKP